VSGREAPGRAAAGAPAETPPAGLAPAPPAGACGRVAVAGAERYCRFAGGAVELLDRPAWEPGAASAGEAALANCRLLAPVLPGKIVAVGLNYRAHAAEFDMDVPDEPILFMKPRSAVIGPGESIVRPARSRRVDYEAELALVIGRRCKGISPAEAADYVSGYTCGNDVTARDLQGVDGQWTRAKSYDTFAPLGPWIVPQAPSPQARVSARIDGAEVQHGLVGDMIVSPLELLAFASDVMTLEPGDVLLTGTPPGVGPLAAGQTVTIAVEGVGALSNPVV
jgi:2-keto-4-pentenoate hydratase/2-oxohepta-3-ene-1,7-dioic acid hydratase in catechol pathway